MSKKIIVTLIIVIVIISISVTFYRTMIAGDFEVITDELVEE